MAWKTLHVNHVYIVYMLELKNMSIIFIKLNGVICNKVYVKYQTNINQIGSDPQQTTAFQTYFEFKIRLIMLGFPKNKKSWIRSQNHFTKETTVRGRPSVIFSHV